MRLSFTIPGQPVALARARVTRFGAYTPKKSKEHQERIRQHAKVAMVYAGMTNLLMLNPLILHCDFFMEPPKKHGQYPVTKPDLSNMVKLVEDALNGIVYLDDSQIVSLSCRKMYGAPGTKVSIEEVE